MPLLLPFDFLEEDMSFDCRERGCEKKKPRTHRIVFHQTKPLSHTQATRRVHEASAGR